jgi:HEAT repeat protein
VVVTSLFASGLGAQQPEKELDPWGEATVAAAFEHDLAKAADIYRNIAGSPEQTAEMQTKALLELGKVLRKAGMIPEAKAALREASQGTGRAAADANRLLEAGSQDPDLLQVKVEKLIGLLRKGSSGSTDDLLWIGEPAAPYLVAAVNKEKANLEFIAGASRVLLQMGGTSADQWAKDALKYTDVLKRRAVVKGFRDVSRKTLKVSAKTVQGFLEDKEASVRRDAVPNLVPLVPAERIITMLKDPDPEVRQAAKHAVQSGWTTMQHGDRRDEHLAQVVEILDRAGWQIGRSNLSINLTFSDTTDGRRLFLRVLRYEVVKDVKVSLYPTEGQRAASTAAELKEVIATADALGMATVVRGSKPGGWQAKASLARFVVQMLETWDHDAMQAVLKLVSLNYAPAFGSQFENWLIKHGKVSDIPAIAKTLRRMRRPDNVLYWMAKQKVPNVALKDLQAFVEWLDGLDWKNDRGNPFRGRERSIRLATCEAIAAIRTGDAESYLVSLIRREPGANQAAAQVEWKDAALDALKKDGGDQTMRTLAELLVIPGDSMHARHVRYGAFQTLAHLQADVAVDRYAKAYRLGFELPGTRVGSVVTIDGQQLCVYGGLRLIVESRGAAPQVRKGRKPYSDETLARIFDSCLATGELVAFQDAAYCVRQMGLPDAVATAIAHRALQCPDRKPDVHRGNPMTLRQLLVRRLVDRYRNAAGIVQLIQGSLRDQDPEIRRLVLGEIRSQHVKDKVVLELTEKCLRDERERIVILASDVLSSHHPESLVAEQDYLLAYKSPYVQSDVAMALLKAKGADAIPTIGKLLLLGTHLHDGHRHTLLKKMAEFRDMRAVPFLLEALKDESDKVRKAAEEELKSIRFYNEQKQLWKRLMDGTDLSEASAAEALVKQASAGSTKDVRLTAIESLGTLGKAETLPFLIKLMSDEDPDIRKAAKKAADRINAAKAKTGAGK